jgi:hypothetical protein
MKNQLFLFWCLAACCLMACTDATQTTESMESESQEEPAALAPAEIGDAKYMDLAKASMTAFTSKDIAKWAQGLSDDVRYNWAYGDSSVGKQAVVDFWTNRMTNVIDSLTFDQSIYLPVKVNQPQSVEQAGNWVLTWHLTTAKYKATGKKMTQWIHSDMHFNDNGNVDQIITYLDRVPIQQATTK